MYKLHANYVYTIKLLLGIFYLYKSASNQITVADKNPYQVTLLTYNFPEYFITPFVLTYDCKNES